MIKSRVLLASEPMILAWFASLFCNMYVIHSFFFDSLLFKESSGLDQQFIVSR